MGVLGVRAGIPDGERASTYKGRSHRATAGVTRGWEDPVTLTSVWSLTARIPNHILFDLPDIPKVSEPQFPHKCYTLSL